MFVANVRLLPALLAGFVLFYAATSLAQFDDGARYGFLASNSASTITIVDLQEHSNVHTIELSDAPDSVAASQALRALVIGHTLENKLTLVDLSTTALDQYEYPLTLSPREVLVSPIGETVAIFDRDQKQLQVHALRRKEVLLTLDDVNSETELTFSPDGAVIYWVDRASGSLESVDLWSKRRTLKFARDNASLSAMSRSVDGTTGFISNADTGEVVTIDLRSFQFARTSHAGRRPGRPWGTADGQYMLVPNADGTITALSTLSGAAIYTAKAVADPVSINPGWIDTTAAIVGADGEIAFLNIADGAELSRLQLEQTPQAGIVTSDSRTLAIPTDSSGTLLFFDMQKRTQISTIENLPVDIGPAALAISNNLCH
jgi:DNA-binding beta-propeller fold protein YncE